MKLYLFILIILLLPLALAVPQYNNVAPTSSSINYNNITNIYNIYNGSSYNSTYASFAYNQTSIIWTHNSSEHIIRSTDGIDKLCLGSASQCTKASHLLSVNGGANITGNIFLDNVAVANSVTGNLEIFNRLCNASGACYTLAELNKTGGTGSSDFTNVCYLNNSQEFTDTNNFTNILVKYYSDFGLPNAQDYFDANWYSTFFGDSEYGYTGRMKNIHPNGEAMFKVENFDNSASALYGVTNDEGHAAAYIDASDAGGTGVVEARSNSLLTLFKARDLNVTNEARINNWNITRNNIDWDCLDEGAGCTQQTAGINAQPYDAYSTLQFNNWHDIIFNSVSAPSYNGNSLCSTGGECDSRYLKIDQTGGQTVINGIPTFNLGLSANDYIATAAYFYGFREQIISGTQTRLAKWGDEDFSDWVELLWNNTRFELRQNAQLTDLQVKNITADNVCYSDGTNCIPQPTNYWKPYGGDGIQPNNDEGVQSVIFPDDTYTLGSNTYYEAGGLEFIRWNSTLNGWKSSKGFYADNLCYGNGTNSTGGSCNPSSSGSSFNETYAKWAYNQSTTAINYLNDTYGKFWYNMTGTSSAPATKSVYRLDNDLTSLYTHSGWIQVLAIPVTANKNYTFNCYFIHNTTITTTSAQFNLTMPSSINDFTGQWLHPTSATASAYVNCFGNSNQCFDNSGTGIVAGSGVSLKGSLINGANSGYANITFRTEVNASVVSTKRGSYCEVDNL